jgi:mRNA-degrading endonuclease RelE of RelBE toxin-antitoxin system
LLRIQANPPEAGLPLLGRLSDQWRTRVGGGYRIIYRIRDEGRLVIVDAIRTRGEAY